MKSIKAQELLDWLCDEEEIKKLTIEEIEDLIEISEMELSGDKALLDKIKNFKKRVHKKPKKLIDILFPV